MGELNQELQAKVIDPARNLNNAINYKRAGGNPYPTWVKEELVKEFFRRMGDHKVKSGPDGKTRAISIGKTLGHDPAALYKWARELKMRSPIMPARNASYRERAKMVAEAKKLRRQGLSFKEIADRMPVKMHYTTVMKWLPKSMRNQHGGPRTKGKPSKKQMASIEATTERIQNLMDPIREFPPRAHGKAVVFTIDEIMACIPQNINQQILDRIELALRRKADSNGKG